MEEITEVKFPAKTYLIWRKEIEMKAMMESNMWQTAYGKVSEYAKKNGIELTGPGVAIYFRWDEPKGKTEIGIGNPVEKIGEINYQDLVVYKVEGTNASMTKVYGDYKQIAKAHEAMMNYMDEKELKPTLTIEEYLVSGMEKPESKDWETTVYYLHK